MNSSSRWESLARQLSLLEAESLQRERKNVAVRSALYGWVRGDHASADRVLCEIAAVVGFHLPDEKTTPSEGR